MSGFGAPHRLIVLAPQCSDASVFFVLRAQHVPRMESERAKIWVDGFIFQQRTCVVNEVAAIGGVCGKELGFQSQRCKARALPSG
jgi:hypothetical protein